jgi:hypothetical protein
MMSCFNISTNSYSCPNHVNHLGISIDDLFPTHLRNEVKIHWRNISVAFLPPSTLSFKERDGAAISDCW